MLCMPQDYVKAAPGGSVEDHGASAPLPPDELGEVVPPALWAWWFKELFLFNNPFFPLRGRVYPSPYPLPRALEGGCRG